MQSDINRAVTRSMRREEAPTRDKSLLTEQSAFARREVVNVANLRTIKDANKLDALDSIPKFAQKLGFIHFGIGAQSHDFRLRHC